MKSSQQRRKPAKNNSHPDHASQEAVEEVVQLRLYVAGQTPKSLAALSNLNRICKTHLNGRYPLQVIDLLKDPQLAQGDQILAIPTPVRSLPTPIRKIIGDLPDIDRVLAGLDLRNVEGVRPSGGRARDEI